MNLTITEDLIHKLYERSRQSRRPAETGIVLTADGWDTHVWTTPSCPYPVALTGEDIDALIEGEDFDNPSYELEEWIIESLLQPEPHLAGSYRIPFEDEDWENREPGEGMTPQVVTGRLEEDRGDLRDAESDWTTAWWFDLKKSRQLIDEPARAEQGRAFSLWVTEGGRYVARLSSAWVGEADEEWVEVTPVQAAEMIYNADPDRVVEEDAPALVVAARALRTAADAIRAPRVPVTEGSFGTVIRRPEQVEEAALRVAAEARAISDLARGSLLPELKTTRAAAARVVVEAAGSETKAAERMGIRQPTLNALLKTPTPLED